ncbi:MAG: FKBP-type peptidyl-prolyl cis-trans isomerase N-terminal domain-containing protein [Rikenellaceae bacterium]
MKKIVISGVVALAVALGACTSSQQSSLVSEGNPSVLDSLSYALGANVGFAITQQIPDVPFDYDLFANGISDAIYGKNTITTDEMSQTLQTYFNETRMQRAEVVEQRRDEADALAIKNGADEATVAANRAAMKADADMFESEAQRSEVSYAFGVSVGLSFESLDVPVQVYWVRTAFKDAQSGNADMNDQESLAFLQNYFTVVRPAELKAISEEELAKVEKMSSVVKTESGLMYRIEKAGDDTLIATDDRDVVRVQYTGRLLRNNKVFDTSRYEDRDEEYQEMMRMQNPDNYSVNEPIEFPLNRVIPGWTEGMKFVGKGGRISLWIPSELAYGERGAGNDIGANEALFFDVEIVDVIPYTE